MLRKGLIRRGVCLFFTIGHYRKLIYLFFSVKAHSSVCRMLKGTWHIILGEKVHAWSTQISLFSTSFIPYQAVSSVCMWLFKKLYFLVHCCFPGVHSCEIIVKRPSGFCASGIQKSITNGTKQPSYREIKRTCVDFVFFSLPALAKGWWPLNNQNLCEYSK